MIYVGTGTSFYRSFTILQTKSSEVDFVVYVANKISFNLNEVTEYCTNIM